MPDVIIKGMEMPESCYYCLFAKTNDDLLSDDYRYMYCDFPEIGAFVTDYIVTRHPDCPLRPAPEWIEFTTREPDDGQRILVKVKYRTHEQVQMDKFYDDSEGCYLDSGYEIVSEVTHWMPLPEPPEGLENA